MGSNNQSSGGVILGFIGFGLFALVGLTVIFGSWYTIDQTQKGVLLRNGAVVGEMDAGLHFKTPWFETVYKIDMQTHTSTYGAATANNGWSFEAYSKDQQPANLRVSVTYHVSPDKVMEMYSRFGGDLDAAVARIITPHVYERVKDVMGQYDAASAIQKRAALNSDAAKSLTESLAYDPVFVIESIQVEDVQFSHDYISSVEARMQAEVKVQQKQQELQQQKIDAEIAVTQATGRANSVIAEAEANAKAVVLNGNAAAAAIEAKAKALGTNPNLIELTKAERWNGILPTTMVPGGAVPFLNVGPQPSAGKL